MKKIVVLSLLCGVMAVVGFKVYLSGTNSKNRAEIERLLADFPSEKDKYNWSRKNLGFSKVYGLRVTYAAEGGLFNYLGLKAGDLLVSLNGKEVKDAESWLIASQKMRGDSSVEIKLYRLGELLQMAAEIHE